MSRRILVVCTTDSMIENFLIPHIAELERRGYYVECASSVTGAAYDNLINLHGIKMNEISFARSPYNLRNLSAYKNLRKLILKKRFDTVFCHEPVGGALGRLAGHSCGCKVIYIAHGFHFYKGAPLINRIVYFSVEKFLSRYTDVLITMNKEDYGAAIKFHSAKKYKINGIGVDTQKFKKINGIQILKSELKLKNDDFILLSVGELIERKNHSVIIDALAHINNPHIHYVIAGDGRLYAFLKKKIKSLCLSDRVHLIGQRSDIIELCNSADAYVLPSLQEGLSVALMEAMSCGKAVIASKIRGNTDLIDEKMGGVLVEAKNPVGFADAISLLYKSPKISEDYGRYNLEKIKAFDIKTVKEQLSSIYDECL